MQLVAYGAQDIYLTGNPQITFFKVVYRRHTNFSMESIEQTWNGDPLCGRATATISRNGDLVHKMYLQQQMLVQGPVFNPAHVGIDMVELEIGGQCIDRHSGQWLEVYSQLCEPNTSPARGVQFSKTGTKFQTMARSGGVFAYTNVMDSYVPLRFWFCKNPGLALPLIALQYHEVRVILSLNRDYVVNNIVDTTEEDCCCSVGMSEDCCVNTTDYSIRCEFDIDVRKHPKGQGGCKGGGNTGQSDLIDVNDGQDPEWDDDCCSSKCDKNGKAVRCYNCRDLYRSDSRMKLFCNRLFVDYIYLDTDERRRFAQVSHEYLIEQVQHQNFRCSGGALDLNFNHPVKELIWTGGMRSEGGMTADEGNIRKTGMPCGKGASLSKCPGVFGSLPGLKDGWLANYEHKNCVTYQLKLNGHDRFSSRDLSYFTTQQVYDHHTGTPVDVSGYDLAVQTNPTPYSFESFRRSFDDYEDDPEDGTTVAPPRTRKAWPCLPPSSIVGNASMSQDVIGVYSFALKPEEHQPSGTCNFSRIDNAQLVINGAPNQQPGQCCDCCDQYDVFAVNYNVLRIMSGMGGLAYSN